MTKEELLKRLHEILEIVGPDRAFEISENTNERKTLWIHQTPGEDEYLMLSATKLFPISTIRNIVYEYGEDIGSYSDGRCQKDANNLMRVHFSHYMNPPSMGNYESFRLSEFVSSKAHVSISTASSIILSLHTIISKAQAPLLSVACSKSYSICTR